MKNKSFPLISIIIINLNGGKWLNQCIKSVLNSDYPNSEIILVDNGSTDGSIEKIKKTFKNHQKIKIIQNQKNLGWSPGNNIGAKNAKGDIFVFLSNDMEVDRYWLKEIVKVMNSDDQIGIVQCNSLSIWDRKTLDSAMNFLDRFGYAYGFRPRQKPREVFFAEGMAFAARSNVYKKIDGLDDYYFMEYDDMDLGWRARLAGFKIFHVPTAKVYHVRGGTVGKTYYDRINNIKWYTRNHLVTITKNYSLINLLYIFPVVFMFELGKIMIFIFKRRWKLAKASLLGIGQFFKDFGLILEKRKKVQKMRKVPDDQILKKMVPFNPNYLIHFLESQRKGKRPFINKLPPIKGGI